MTESDVLKWIKNNLSSYIKDAIKDSIYPESLIAGITCRETGGLISKYAFSPAGNTVNYLNVCALLRGDYSQRHGETEKKYHGYGLTQIDTGSFPDFIKSGWWEDPSKVYPLTIKILNGKRDYILSHAPDNLIKDVQGNLLHYVVAAYNCGEGNEMKVINQHLDPDAYTTQHNYSKDVFRLSEIYQNLV